MTDPRSCAAEGCPSVTTGFSRFCRRHRWQFYRAGDPNGRILRRTRDLGPYRKLAAEAIERNRDHAGVTGAIHWLEQLMDWAAEFQGGGVRADLAKNLRRLRRDGATGEAMFARVLAVAFYAEDNKRTWKDDVCHTVNLAHHCLYTTPVPSKRSRSGKPNRVNLKRTTKLELGKMLRETLGLLMVKLWQATEAREHRERIARDAIKAAMDKRPLE